MLRLIASAIVAAALASAASAQEAHLRGVSAFAEKTTYSRGFEKFIERVNASGKGVIQINYIGGPKAMPPFEVGNALEERRRRHRQRDRRLLHQRDAGGRRLEAHRSVRWRSCARTAASTTWRTLYARR